MHDDSSMTHHRTPLTRSRSQTNPSFFDEQPPSHWDIIAYLNQHDPNDPSYDHRTVIDKWTKSLAAIAGDGCYSKERRDKARVLLLKYKDTVSLPSRETHTPSTSPFDQRWDADDLLAHLPFNLLACEASAGSHRAADDPLARLFSAPVGFTGPPEDLKAPLFSGPVSGVWNTR